MLIGTVAAMAHGCGWPSLNIIFGRLVDSFIDFDRNSTDYNATIAPDVDPYQAFDDQMQEFAIIFAYIGAAALCAGFLQVCIRPLMAQAELNALYFSLFDR